MPNNPGRLSNFWNELKRRRILPFLIGYIAACFAIIEFVLNASETFSFPDSTIRLLYILAAIGIPVVILIPWHINRKKPFSEADDPGETDLPGKSDKAQAPEKSIIVMPFENISPDPDQEYFSDGLTEEIITDLSYIDDLLVISRSSAMTFKGTKLRLQEVTRKVNVRYALEGSVRKAGDNIRIVAQLIDGINDSHIWADKYSGTLEDIFDIQEKVSRSIAHALKIRLTSLEKEKIDKRPIDNAFAYDCYRKAHTAINSMTKERIDFGLNLLQKGLEVAGENAVIFAGMGAAHMQYVNNGFEAERNMARAEEFLEKALKLDPELPVAHFTLGMITIFKDGDAYSAVEHWKRAHMSNPDDPEIMLWLALMYGIFGKHESAQKFVDTIARIDPFNQHCDAVRGWVTFFAGNFETALDPLLAAYKLAPENPMHRFWKALILFYNHRADEAYDFIDEVINETDKNIWVMMTRLLQHTIKKDKEKVATLLTQEVAAQVQMDLQLSFHLATFYSYLEEGAESLKWLESAVNRGFINYPLISEQDILLQNIRDGKGFKSLIKKVRQLWDNYIL